MKASLKRASRFLLLFLILAGCVYILTPGFAKYNKEQEKVERLEEEIRRLEAERARLEEHMRALEEGDPEHIERLAREKLHLVKPGETIFRFKKK